jgi:hypothetical protein
MSLTLLEAAKAKLEGKRVEVKSPMLNWRDWSGDLWAEHWEFRIAPEPKKKVKILCWFDGSSLFWRPDQERSYDTWQRVPAEDKEIEVDDV